MKLIWLNENIAALRVASPLVWQDELQPHGLSALLQLQSLPQPLPAEIIHLQLALPGALVPDDGLLAALTRQLPLASGFISDQLQQGHKLLMTAADGGLLGVMMAQWLVCEGTAPVHAVAQVRTLYDDAFSVDGWDQFIFDVLYRLQA
ncbi:hypothetical protein [Shewanella sp. YIC-542]|uniref:hypothetical protein n=1 Tax=Shewanella mytili TaxID=3377111 RepID=UPI00398EBD2E